MVQAAHRHPCRGDGASNGDLEIARKLTQDESRGNVPQPFILPRDAMASGTFDQIIQAGLLEIAQRRPVNAVERRLRCMTKPRPWRSEGVSPSAWYRRRRRARALLLAEMQVVT
jgi:hypothetical protein